MNEGLWGLPKNAYGLSSIEQNLLSQTLSRANSYFRCGKLVEAETVLNESYFPSHPKSIFLLALIAEAKKDYQKAEGLLRVLVKLNPSAKTHHHLVELFTYLGDYERAWQELDICNFYVEIPYKQTLVSLLDSSESDENSTYKHEIMRLVGNLLNDGVLSWKDQPLEGKNILLYLGALGALEGLGDAIMFFRFVPKIAALGANIFLAVPPSLRVLASQLPVTIWSKELHPKIDYHLSLHLLAGRFDIQVGKIPSKPYIKPDPNLVTCWQQYLSGFSGMKVGLCWRAKANDSSRSIPAECLTQSQLFSIAGVSFFSIQVHKKAASDLQKFKSQGINIIDLASEIGNFHQTAAAISALDLVISVDTATSNLCGAMGREDWVLLPFYKDFRWLHGWYPSIKPFCQKVNNKWEAVLSEIIEQLKIKLNSN